MFIKATVFIYYINDKDKTAYVNKENQIIGLYILSINCQQLYIKPKTNILFTIYMYSLCIYIWKGVSSVGRAAVTYC